MNLKHQAAIEQREERVIQLRAEIHETLTRLVELDSCLEDLADTRQATGLGFLTPDAQARADEQARTDRLARRTIPDRIDPATGDLVLGQDWLNGEVISNPGYIGQSPAPVTMPAVSMLAEISFTVQDHVRRLSARLMPIVEARQEDAYEAFARQLRAEQAGGYCSWPKPTFRLHPLYENPPATDGTLVELTGHLGRLVDAFRDRTRLEAILRDLNHVAAKASDVVDGPASTPHPDPCPWCGHKSLVIHHRATGRAEAFIRCEGTHPCRCDDEWCGCRRPLPAHKRPRHEWVNSGRATHTWRALAHLTETRKEQAVIEHKATAARERALALHAEVPIYLLIAECQEPETHQTRGLWVDSTDGIYEICEGCPVGESICEACTDLAGEHVTWPCATVTALELDPPDTDNSPDQPQEPTR